MQEKHQKNSVLCNLLNSAYNVWPEYEIIYSRVNSIVKKYDIKREDEKVRRILFLLLMYPFELDIVKEINEYEIISIGESIEDRNCRSYYYLILSKYFLARKEFKIAKKLLEKIDFSPIDFFVLTKIINDFKEEGIIHVEKLVSQNITRETIRDAVNYILNFYKRHRDIVARTKIKDVKRYFEYIIRIITGLATIGSFSFGDFKLHKDILTKIENEIQLEEIKNIVEAIREITLSEDLSIDEFETPIVSYFPYKRLIKEMSTKLKKDNLRKWVSKEIKDTSSYFQLTKRDGITVTKLTIIMELLNAILNAPTLFPRYLDVELSRFIGFANIINESEEDSEKGMTLEYLVEMLANVRYEKAQPKKIDDAFWTLIYAYFFARDKKVVKRILDNVMSMVTQEQRESYLIFWFFLIEFYVYHYLFEEPDYKKIIFNIKPLKKGFYSNHFLIYSTIFFASLEFGDRNRAKEAFEQLREDLFLIIKHEIIPEGKAKEVLDRIENTRFEDLIENQDFLREWKDLLKNINLINFIEEKIDALIILREYYQKLLKVEYSQREKLGNK